ncbi:serpin family protein [Bacillus sp. D386]|uniref:serpin family protein n=1 Tax=Bacillus sp. D386 TaxID=2587155 RepID=UPI00111F7278|nr:serpin family protein [Bacillus sp. D386]
MTYSKEDFESLIEQDDAETLSEIIQFDTIDEEADLDWYGEKLLQLSEHPDDDLSISIANKIWNDYTYQFSEDTLKKFIELFKNDTDSDVRSYADMITEKINYSIEDLKMEMVRENTDYGYNVVSSFMYKDNSYHVIQKDNKWILESLTGADQSFDSIEQFFKEATLGGIPLTDAWVEVKII